MKKFTILAAAMLTMASASATEMDFTYNLEGAEPTYYGTGKKEVYDVAVCINNPSLKGAKIMQISVPLPGDAELYSSTSAFLTSELKVERVDGVRVNVPDICSVDATIADGKLTAKFAEPYVLGDDPVYVGYTFEIEKLEEVNKAPVAIAPGDNEDGFWFHSSRTQLKWSSYVNKENPPIQSAMTILLDGNFVGESAGVVLPERTILLTDQANPYTFTVINGGAEPINSIDYTWAMKGQEGEGSYTFTTPIRGILGAFGTAELALPAVTEKGEAPLTVTVTKVNGVANPNLAASADATVIFSPVVPVMRPLIEEYTGLWCGWCPRGYAALEYMGEEYGRDFVAAAWHNADQMSITNSYPSAVGGFPTAFANRLSEINLIDIESLWPQYCAEPIEISIECELEFDNEAHTAVKATATVTSISDQKANYRIGYTLLADGLQDPTWQQHNYYAGQYASALAHMPEKYAELFGKGSDPITGLVFNDVVVANGYVGGVMNSLPAELVAFEPNTHSVTYDLTELICNTTKEPIAIDNNKVRVLAYILDEKGKVVNSCSSIYPDGNTAVESVESEAEVVSTLWLDLQGRAVAAPAHGIFVRVQTLADGTVRAAKVAVK